MRYSSNVRPETISQYSVNEKMICYNITEKKVTDTMTEDKHTEYECDYVIVEGEITIGKLVDAMVRDKYSMSEELAILRQRDTKAEHFAEYNTYVEECKVIANDILK